MCNSNLKSVSKLNTILLKLQGQASTARRDELLRYQKEAQKRWQEDKLFEVDAPAEGQQSFGGCCVYHNAELLCAMQERHGMQESFSATFLTPT